jgi:hypothetical protein
LTMPEGVPLVVDELEVPPVDVEFCAARAWAAAINACESVSAAEPFVAVVPEVPAVELVVVAEFVAAVVAVVAVVAAGVVLVGVPVDAVFVVPTAALLDVVLTGAAVRKLTVIFAPSTFAVLDSDTTVGAGAVLLGTVILESNSV